MQTVQTGAHAAQPLEQLTEEHSPGLPAEAMLDLLCLRQSYPQTGGLEKDAQGRWWLQVGHARVLYSTPEAGEPSPQNIWETDVRTSMAQVYPLEPQRPATEEGVSPGRRRSTPLLQALYGADAPSVRKQLQTMHIAGQRVVLSAPLAAAVARVDARLKALRQTRPELDGWLRSSGGFAWRNIAGEDRLSPHSFGMALDLSAHRAAYWRWSRLRPHPQQQSYPTEIVQAFEDEGFIWGGKWHEYDTMHFEYRPELLCKARLLAKRAQGTAQGIRFRPDPAERDRGPEAGTQKPEPAGP